MVIAKCVECGKKKKDTQKKKNCDSSDEAPKLELKQPVDDRLRVLYVRGKGTLS